MRNVACTGCSLLSHGDGVIILSSTSLMHFSHFLFVVNNVHPLNMWSLCRFRIKQSIKNWREKSGNLHFVRNFVRIIFFYFSSNYYFYFSSQNLNSMISLFTFLIDCLINWYYVVTCRGEIICFCRPYASLHHINCLWYISSHSETGWTFCVEGFPCILNIVIYLAVVWSGVMYCQLTCNYRRESALTW